MRIFLFLLELVYLYLAFETGKTIYFIVASVLFFWWLYEYKTEANRMEEFIEKDSIKKIETIPHTSYILSMDYLRAMVIDENSNMFYLAEREDIESNFEEKGHSFEEIFEVAIVEDNEITSLISRGGVYGWSLIDGGASIKVNGKEPKNVKSEQEVEDEEEVEVEEQDVVKKLSIRLVVNDLSNPIVEYIFIDEPEGMEKDSEEYKELVKECENWHQKITVIIKRHEKVPVLNWA